MYNISCTFPSFLLKSILLRFNVRTVHLVRFITQTNKCTIYTGLFEMIVGVLTTCHTQYSWDRSICIFLFNRTTPQGFVTYLTGALYVHPLWFYRHQHDNRVRSKLSVACNNLQFRDTCGKRRNINLILNVNPIERTHMGLHLKNEVARRVASDYHRVDVCRIRKGAHIEHL